MYYYLNLKIKLLIKKKYLKFNNINLKVKKKLIK